MSSLNTAVSIELELESICIAVIHNVFSVKIATSIPHYPTALIILSPMNKVQEHAMEILDDCCFCQNKTQGVFSGKYKNCVYRKCT